MPTGTRNLATGSSAPKRVGATSQAVVGAVAVAFEALSPGSLSGCFAPRLIRVASNRLDAIPNQSIQATPVPDRRSFKPAARVATAKA
jgi:hypothetical protein